MRKELIIISLGGSLIVPKEVDIDFLKSFKKIIDNFLSKKRFIIICGGGSVARKYQEAIQSFPNTAQEDSDWLGIKSTELNASLLKLIFKKKAHSKIISDPTRKVDFSEDVLIASGWKPGCSTDYDAVLLAEKFGAKKILNLTDIDYVYNKDPDKFENAVPIKKISWERFRKLLPAEWRPGLSSPFDPIASKKAEELGLEVAILKGEKEERLKNYLQDKEFTGTLIK